MLGWYYGRSSFGAPRATMPAHEDHRSVPARKDDGTAPRMDTALDAALREVLAEQSPRNGTSGPHATGPGGAAPQALIAPSDDNTAPNELDLNGHPVGDLDPTTSTAGTAVTVADGRTGVSATPSSNDGLPTRPPTPPPVRPGARPAPQATGRDGMAEPDRRESLVLEALLLQVPGVDSLAVFKLGAAGFNRFIALRRCTADDIVSVTGISREAANQIVAELADWTEGPSGPPHGGEAQVSAWRSLQPLLEELELLNGDLDRAASGWSREQLSSRRRVRLERDRVYTAVKAALATVGELDLLLRLEKVPFSRRVDELHRLLRAGAAAGVLASTRKSTTGGETSNGRTNP